MDNAMNVNLQNLISAHRGGVVNRAGSTGQSIIPGNVQKTSGPAFSDILRSKVEQKELKFSAHAAARMKSRDIELTGEMMAKLENAVNSAAGKGARDSLIVMKNCAFIVNIPNRTVITAMDGASLKENIFTNIDSAVIAES
jgi:flagellar operon protein